MTKQALAKPSAAGKRAAAAQLPPVGAETKAKASRRGKQNQGGAAKAALAPEGEPLAKFS